MATEETYLKAHEGWLTKTKVAKAVAVFALSFTTGIAIGVYKGSQVDAYPTASPAPKFSGSGHITRAKMNGLLDQAFNADAQLLISAAQDSKQSSSSLDVSVAPTTDFIKRGKSKEVPVNGRQLSINSLPLPSSVTPSEQDNMNVSIVSSDSLRNAGDNIDYGNVAAFSGLNVDVSQGFSSGSNFQPAQSYDSSAGQTIYHIDMFKETTGNWDISVYYRMLGQASTSAATYSTDPGKQSIDLGGKSPNSLTLPIDTVQEAQAIADQSYTVIEQAVHSTPIRGVASPFALPSLVSRDELAPPIIF